MESNHISVSDWFQSLTVIAPFVTVILRMHCACAVHKIALPFFQEKKILVARGSKQSCVSVSGDDSFISHESSTLVDRFHWKHSPMPLNRERENRQVSAITITRWKGKKKVLVIIVISRNVHQPHEASWAKAPGPIITITHSIPRWTAKKEKEKNASVPNLKAVEPI